MSSEETVRAPEASDEPVLLPALDETDRPENAKRMMRTALQLFARKGYAGTSVREIVEAADVTNPMLYYYFDSKQGLFTALVTYLMESLGTDLSEQLADSDDLETQIEVIFQIFFEKARETPVALTFLYQALFGPEENVPDFDVYDLRATMLDAVVGAFDRAIEEGDFDPTDTFDSTYLAEQLLGLINNHFIRALQESRHLDTPRERRAHLQSMLSEREAEKLRTFFLRGAGRLPGEGR